jgi:hypothetical protein
MPGSIGGQLDSLNSTISSKLGTSVSYFNNLSNRIASSMSNMYTVGRNATKNFVDGLKSVYIPTPHINVSSYTSHKVGTTSFNTPNFRASWYASGGLPEMGEMFIAREKGPELIGRIGNKNAVVNNDQIVDSVEGGVYRAVVAALSDIGGSVQDNGTNITITLEGDVKNLFKLIRKEGQNYQKSTGLPVFD